MSDRTITPNQQNFLKSLLTERADVLGITDVDAFIRDQKWDLLTSKSASTVIDKIKSIKVKPADERFATADRVITNRFDKACADCGNVVPTGAGFAVQIGDKWATYHKVGECGSKVAPFDLDTALTDVSNCYVALPSATGNNDLDFFGVRTSRTSKRRYIVRVIGGHSDTIIKGAEARKVAERLTALSPDELQEAVVRYGLAIGKCGLCNRHLTDEASRQRGLGPECASKC
jgi:hypothetical protein